MNLVCTTHELVLSLCDLDTGTQWLCRVDHRRHDLTIYCNDQHRVTHTNLASVPTVEQLKTLIEVTNE